MESGMTHHVDSTDRAWRRRPHDQPMRRYDAGEAGPRRIGSAGLCPANPASVGLARFVAIHLSHLREPC